MKINRKSKEGAIKTLIGLAVCLTLALTLGSFALSDVLTPSSPTQSKANTSNTLKMTGETNSVMGDFNVTGDTSGCSFSGDVLTISGGSPTIAMAPGKESTEQRIEVTGAANITLAGVNISRTNAEVSAMPICVGNDANVIITLKDDSNNILQAGNGCAGLCTYNTVGTLTITGTGKLIAIGGYHGAGIGGNNGRNGNNITISGGVINAIGGYCAAGIGGGSYGSGNGIKIEGGIVTASGGVYSELGLVTFGAGIGGGFCGTGSDITISGGVVTATGGEKAAGIGGGVDGTGSSNNTINGDTVVIATSGFADKPALEGFTYTRGIAFTKRTESGTWSSDMYGNSVKVTENVQFPADFTVPDGKTVTLADNKTLTIASGATLTVASGGTLVNDGILPEDDSIVCQSGGQIKTKLNFYETEGALTPTTSNEDTIYKNSDVVQKYQSPALIALPAGAEGWYTGWDGKGSKITTNENVQLNLHNLYAYYDCVVKFNTGVSSVTVPDQFVEYKAKAKDPGTLPITEIDGKKKYIEGWYKDASCTSKWDFNTDTVMPASGNEITLYAKWVDCLQVSFDLQGGSVANTNAINSGIDTEYLRSGEYATKPTQTVVKEGFSFKDWYPNKEGTGVSFDFKHTKITKDTVLYAVWIQDAFNINAVQPAHGHIEGPDTGEKNTTIRFEVHAAEEGWQVKNGSVTVTTDGGVNVPVTKVTSNGGGEEDDYTFVMPEDNVTITAEMEKIPCTVTFKTGNGSADTTKTVDYGDAVAQPSDPSWENHRFVGWFKDGESSVYNFSTPVKGNITICAHWIERYNIELNQTGNGNVNITQTQAEKGDTVTFTASPDEHWYMDGLPTFTPEGGEPQDVTESSTTPGTYTFTMPDKAVTVNVVFKITTHTVTFHTQVEDIPAPETQTIDYGSYATEPTDPTREKFQLVGWYTKANPGETDKAYDFEKTAVTADIDLYAQWVQVAFDITSTDPTHGHIDHVDYAEQNTTVKFKVEGTDEGWQAKDSSVTVKTAAGSKPIEVKGSKGEYEFTMPSEDVVISAEMEKIPCTVTFDTQNDDDTTTVTVDYGDAVAQPSDPSWENHRFVGWYKDGESTIYNFSTPIKGDFTIYAHWVDLYDIELNQTGSGNVEFEQTQAAQGDTVTFTASPDEHWYMDELPTFTPEGGEPQDVTESSTTPGTYTFTMPDKAVTVNVVFKITTHTVTFHTQVEDIPAPETQTIDYGSYATEPEAPTREHYEFVGWYTNPEGTGMSYDFQHNEVIEDVDLYAIWLQDSFEITSIQPEHGHIKHPNFGKQYTTIKFEAHEADEGWQVKKGSVTVKTTKDGTPIDVTELDTDYDDYSFEMPNEAVTITAEMEKIPCTVTFDSQNGSADTTSTVDYGDPVIKPSTDPTRDGYKFDGWYDNKDCEGDAYDFLTPVKSNFTLYAKWLKIYDVTATNSGKGNVDLEQIRAVVGDTITFTANPEIGWYIDGTPTFTPDGEQPQDVTESSENPGTYTFTMPDKAVNVNANFKITTHKVTFHTQVDGVPDPDSQTIDYGSYSTEPEDPVREEYQLVGWYTNPEGTGETFDFDCVPITEDIDLYAIWAQNVYPIVWEQPEHGDIQSVKAAPANADVQFRVHALNEDKFTYELGDMDLTAADGTEVKFEKVDSKRMGRLGDTNDDLYHFTMPSSPVNISATFELVTYDIAVEDTEHGTIEVNKDKAAESEEVEITGNPDQGYKLDGSSLMVIDNDGNEILVTERDGKYVFTMPGTGVRVSGAFEEDTYEISVDQTEHGAVTVDHENSKAGDEVIITATPEDGYRIDGLPIVKTEDGRVIEVVPTGNPGEYKFIMPNSNVTLDTNFAPNPTPTPEPAPDPSADPDGGGSDESGRDSQSGSGNSASSKTSDPFMGGVALALLGVATTGAVLVRKRK